MDIPQYTPKITNRFWQRVNKSGSIPAHCPELGSCWEWTGAKVKGGYGSFRIGKSARYSHRIAWELSNGHISNGLRVLHKCDNPVCCNPMHLFLGTQADNVKDMLTKGRGRYQRNR